MAHTPTVTAHFSKAILQAARRLGLSLPPGLGEGLERTERVAMADQDRLWEQFCRTADNPLVGLELGLEVQAGHLDTAGLILMTCETMGEGLEALLEYHPIVGEGSGFQVYREGALRYLCYQPIYQVCREQRVEAALASLWHLSHASTGGRFRARAIHFRHAPLAALSGYQERLAVPVRFNAADNALVFDHDQLALPLLHANAALCRHLRDLGDQLLTQLKERSLSDRTRTLIRAQPGWGKERIAERLGMSGRHLVRKLGEEGTSFKLLRDTLLRKRAEQALEEGHRLADIAADLGFSDESAFAKTFKRWTGATPGQFRRHAPGAQD